MSRFSVTSTVAAGAAALSLAAASPALALDPPTAPTATTTVIPGGTQSAEAWKLVGRGTASAVQIAPRWVISANHSPIAVGSTFANAYGSSTVEQQINPECGYGCGTDVTLHLLSSPITAPSFPKLLGESVAAKPSALPGSLLSVGYGKVDAGNTPSIGWTKPDGQPVAGQSTAPGTWYGDSGGPSFWYPSTTGAPVLAGLMVYLGSTDLGFQQGLSESPANTAGTLKARDWLAGEFAKVPGTPAPEFVNAAGAVDPNVAGRPDPAKETYLATGGASVVRVAWTNPTFGTARTGYKIFVNGTLKTTVAANATSVRITGLSWLTNYTVRVVATSAQGDAAPSLLGGDTVAFKTRWLF